MTASCHFRHCPAQTYFSKFWPLVVHVAMCACVSTARKCKMCYELNFKQLHSIARPIMSIQKAVISSLAYNLILIFLFWGLHLV